MKLWAMPCRAIQTGQVMVESSDQTWSTGEGNAKPLQYSCLEPYEVYDGWKWHLLAALICIFLINSKAKNIFLYLEDLLSLSVWTVVLSLYQCFLLYLRECFTNYRNESFVMMLKIIFLLFFYVPLASSFIYDAFYHTEIYNCYMFKSVSHFLHGF